MMIVFGWVLDLLALDVVLGSRVVVVDDVVDVVMLL
jgi:hypothetical protein